MAITILLVRQRQDNGTQKGRQKNFFIFFDAAQEDSSSPSTVHFVHFQRSLIPLSKANLSCFAMKQDLFWQHASCIHIVYLNFNLFFFFFTSFLSVCLRWSPGTTFEPRHQAVRQCFSLALNSICSSRLACVDCTLRDNGIWRREKSPPLITGGKKQEEMQSCFGRRTTIPWSHSIAKREEFTTWKLMNHHLVAKCILHLL